MKKRLLSFLFVVILCVSGAGSAFAANSDVSPYWLQLLSIACDFGEYNGWFSNSYVSVEAKCKSTDYDVRLTVSIQKKSGSQYIDTGKSWTAGPSTNAFLEKNFSLDSGCYIAHCTAVVLDSAGRTVETVYFDSNEYIVV